MGFLGAGKFLYRGVKSSVTGGWRSVGNLGAHTKGAMLLAGGSYLGWKKITTGNLPGERTFKTGAEVVQKTAEAASKGLDGINKGLDYVNKGLDKIPEMVRDTKEAFTGGGDDGGNGQGEGLFNNLFGSIRNLLGGLFNGGTGNLLGLVAGAFLFFGGSGWMSKIGGALLAALSLGMFSGNKRNRQQEHPIVQQVPARQESQDGINHPNMDMEGQVDGSHTIHRTR